MGKRETPEEAAARLKERAEKKAKKCMIFYSGREPVQVERPEKGESAIHLLPRSQKEVTEADLDTLKEAKVDFVRVASPQPRSSPFGSGEKTPGRQPPSSAKPMAGEAKTSESDPSQSLFRSKSRAKKTKK